MTDRIPLIYIAGPSHCGSTLLDLMLGSASGVWTLGEAQVLPVLANEDTRPCGCGRRIHECDFWGPVLKDTPLPGSRFPLQFFRAPGREYGRMRSGLLRDAVAGRVSDWRREAAEEYGRVNAVFLSAVRGRAIAHSGGEVRWLVDASKSPYRLLWLAHSALFDLRVVHITRDPRGFVHSDRQRNGGALPRVARITGRWLAWNFLASRVAGRSVAAEHRILVRYEDLAGDPAGTMARMSEWLGLPLPSGGAGEFRDYVNHAIGGNSMRWNGSGLALDEEWRSGLPPLDRFAAWALSWPWRRRYGYA